LLHIHHRHLRGAVILIRQCIIIFSVCKIQAFSSVTRTLDGYRKRTQKDFQNILLLRFALRRSSALGFTALSHKNMGQ
jgi:hypothetical protein